MGLTASFHSNRITVCLTTPQRQYLSAGMQKHKIGLSEYIRRCLDRVLADDEEKDLERVRRLNQ